MYELFPDKQIKTLAKEVTIYTDGACSGNPGPGGWGALLIYNDVRKTISGSEIDSTNNRMELMAVIQALKLLKDPCKVTVYTDSKYVEQGASDWMHKWKKNNWRRGNSPVKNEELWKQLDSEINRHQVQFRWVKAHNGHIENELVDKLARAACSAR
jgi:ribonuclease HI